MWPSTRHSFQQGLFRRRQGHRLTSFFSCVKLADGIARTAKPQYSLSSHVLDVGIYPSWPQSRSLEFLLPNRVRSDPTSRSADLLQQNDIQQQFEAYMQEVIQSGISLRSTNLDQVLNQAWEQACKPAAKTVVDDGIVIREQTHSANSRRIQQTKNSANRAEKSQTRPPHSANTEDTFSKQPGDTHKQERHIQKTADMTLKQT